MCDDENKLKPNYEDLNASTIIEYALDEDDFWTLEDLQGETDPNN